METDIMKRKVFNILILFAGIFLSAGSDTLLTDSPYYNIVAKESLELVTDEDIPVCLAFDMLQDDVVTITRASVVGGNEKTDGSNYITKMDMLCFTEEGIYLGYKYYETIYTEIVNGNISYNPDAKVFLIGNKIDLEKDRKITKEEGEEFAKLNRLNFFIEASAKTGINAQNIFVQAAKTLYQDHLKYKNEMGNEESSEPMKTMDITKKLVDDKKKPNKGGCC